jgi:hypothetical protein
LEIWANLKDRANSGPQEWYQFQKPGTATTWRKERSLMVLIVRKSLDMKTELTPQVFLLYSSIFGALVWHFKFSLSFDHFWSWHHCHLPVPLTITRSLYPDRLGDSAQLNVSTGRIGLGSIPETNWIMQLTRGRCSPGPLSIFVYVMLLTCCTESTPTYARCATLEYLILCKYAKLTSRHCTVLISCISQLGSSYYVCIPKYTLLVYSNWRHILGYLPVSITDVVSIIPMPPFQFIYQLHFHTGVIFPAAL